MTKPNEDKSEKPEIIAIVCRAAGNCEGRQSKIVWRKKLPNGGTNFRYRCLTCNKTWFLTL